MVGRSALAATSAIRTNSALSGGRVKGKSATAPTSRVFSGAQCEARSAGNIDAPQSFTISSAIINALRGKEFMSYLRKS